MRSIDSALNITLTDNGRILRNIIHGADTVMSHILHFYHLAAVDFIDASALGSPWSSGTFGPAFGTLSNAALLPVTARNILGNCIVLNYVEALNIRRDAHTLSAIFSGRHPIQNAIVPGGVASIVTASDVERAKTIINKIRNFINLSYIPDVVTAATVTTAPYNFAAYWNVGTNPNRLLSYGEYPLDGANAPFVSITNPASMLLQRGTANGLSLGSFDPANITERVNYSYYSSADNLHPSVGETTPNPSKTDAYSWLKAPRYNGQPYEVGPLARVLVSYLTRTGGTTTPTVSEAGSASASYLNLPANYDIANLVDAAVGVVNTYLGGWGSIGYTNLYSPLGRHAARALECKFVADAIGGGVNGGSSWLDSLTFTPATQGATQAVAYGYTYVPIPKATVMGTGLCEAPRGALGHWITIQSKKIGRYQCVVPSTWNNGPRGANSTDLGVSESVLIGLQACNGDPTSDPGLMNDAVLNIARMLHPYDFCTACAVHIVSPEGKELAKFSFDSDGKIRRIPVDSE